MDHASRGFGVDFCGMGDAVKRFTLEVHLREAGDVPGPVVLAIVSVPGRTVRLGHETVSGAVDWARREIQAWLRGGVRR